MTGSTGGKAGADWLAGVHRPDTVAALGKCRVRDKLIYISAPAVVDAVSYRYRCTATAWSGSFMFQG